MTAQQAPDYFVVMLDFGKRGREATVDPEMTSRGAVDAVAAAWGDGNTVSFVHHIHDGICEDVTEELFGKVMDAVASSGDAPSRNMRDAIEQHFGLEAANCFAREDA